MKTMNQLIDEYTHHLQQGEIQTAYNIRNYRQIESRFYQKIPALRHRECISGYMDMTYFSLNAKPLKDEGQK